MYSFRIPAEAMEKVQTLYLTQGVGLSRIIDNFYSLRRVAIQTLYNVFTREELSMLVVTLNGVELDGKLMAQRANLVIHIRDREAYEGACTKWKVDVDPFIKKVEILNPVEVMVIFDEIWRFWNIPSAYGAPNPNLHRFLADWGSDV